MGQMHELLWRPRFMSAVSVAGVLCALAVGCGSVAPGAGTDDGSGPAGASNGRGGSGSGEGVTVGGARPPCLAVPGEGVFIGDSYITGFLSPRLQPALTRLDPFVAGFRNHAVAGTAMASGGFGTIPPQFDWTLADLRSDQVSAMQHVVQRARLRDAKGLHRHRRRRRRYDGAAGGKDGRCGGQGRHLLLLPAHSESQRRLPRDPRLRRPVGSAAVSERQYHHGRAAHLSLRGADRAFSSGGRRLEPGELFLYRRHSSVGGGPGHHRERDLVDDAE
jgi:hypothetical protein